jgi:CRISPR-associated protein Csx16
MTTYFITRHTGALAWAKLHDVAFDVHLEHLIDLGNLQVGDVIIGTLPIQMVAKLNDCGVRYVHLSLDIPPAWRGRELTADELRECRASLQEFQVSLVN